MKWDLLLHVLMLSSVYYMQQIEPPIAHSISVTAVQNLPLAITLIGMGTDIVAFDIQSTISDSGGSLIKVSPESQFVVYTPAQGYLGQDSFAFTVINASGVVSAPAIVCINVVPLAPKAYARCVHTISNIAMNIKICGFDLAGESLTFALAALPSHGKISGFPCALQTGSVIVGYMPNPEYFGQDSFQFTVTNASGVVSSPATVVIKVLCNPSSGSQQASLYSMIAKYSGM